MSADHRTTPGAWEPLRAWEDTDQTARCSRIEERPGQFICHPCEAMWFKPADDVDYRPRCCVVRRAESASVKK